MSAVEPVTTPATTGWRPAELVAARMETRNVRTLRLRAPGLGGGLAGQHVDIRLTADDGYTAQRSYSLATAEPGDEAEVTVEELEDGEVSPYLVRGLEPGHFVEVQGPIGGWFVWHPDATDPVVLIAGGSGVVPLMAMARLHRAVGSPVPFTLLYSVRTPADVIYRAELDELAADPAAPFRVHYLFTREGDGVATRPVGRITREDVAAVVTPDAQLFVCGPNAFVGVVAGRLVEDGFPAERIKTERFG